MKNTGFDKALFKSAVTFNVKNMFRRTIDEATPQQIFQAVAYTVKDDIIDQWITTHKEYEKKDVKTLYYLSMEFLMGRALGNNMINLREYKEITEALDEMGFDLKCYRRPGAGCSIRKRWSRTSSSMLPGFFSNPGLSGIWLRYPLPLWYVQTEDRRRLSGRSSG